MRDIFEDIFENQPLDPTEAARRGMRPEAADAVLSGRRRCGEGAEGFAGAARRPAGAHARRGGSLAAPVRELAEAHRRRMAGAAGQDRSGGDAADAARQLDHRRRGAGARSRSRPRSRSISAPTCCSIAPPGRTDLVARQARALGPGARMGARDTRRALRAGRGRDARGAAGSGDRGGGRGDPERRGHRSDAWRLGALNVVTTLTGSALLALALAAGPAHRRRGVDRRACRRGLEHGVLGARRAGAGAPRLSLRRDAGGGAVLLCARCASRFCRPVCELRIELRCALEARLGLGGAVHRLQHKAAVGVRLGEIRLQLDRAVELASASSSRPSAFSASPRWQCAAGMLRIKRDRPVAVASASAGRPSRSSTSARLK